MQDIGLWVYSGRAADPVQIEIVLNTFREAGMNLYTLPEMSGLLPDITVLEADTFFRKVSAVAALGGDGTVLGASRACSFHGVPVFGVNLGHKGFLSGTEPEGLAGMLANLKENRFTIEPRMMLQATVIGFEGSPVYALNDVLICDSKPMSMIRTSARSGDQEIGDFDSDGLLVSTPTGSTAYNLSAGGPVIGPGVSALILTPLHAHSMRSVPLVLSSDEELFLKYEEEGTGLLIADGRVLTHIDSGATVRVERSPYDALMIRTDPEQFYKVLYAKLK